MSEELLTGREGIEASQGYVPGDMAGDAPPEAPIDSTTLLDPLREIAPEEPITEVKVQDEFGNERPENETLTAEQAARGLAGYRNKNADAIEAGLKEAIASEADELRGVKSPEQPEQTPQPEQHQPSEQIPGVDPEVQAALSNPKVLSLLQNYEQQVNQQVAAHAAQYEQARTEFANGLRQNAALSVAAVLAIPELAGIGLDQIPTALQIIQKQSPERAQQIATQINRAQQVVGQMQAMAAQEQQRQVQQYQAQWDQFAKAEDDKFDALMPTGSAIAGDAMKTL
jgi:hypothetical protein